MALARVIAMRSLVLRRLLRTSTYDYDDLLPVLIESNYYAVYASYCVRFLVPLFMQKIVCRIADVVVIDM